jgi:hypothetical protein
MVNQLHRFSYFDYNSDGRRVKHVTPWHPNLDFLQQFKEMYYPDTIVKYESIPCKSTYSSNNDNIDPFFNTRE